MNSTILSFIVSEGVALTGEAYGPADGTPVILAHGGGQTRHAWRGTATQLAEHGWRAVTLDLRGHGDSEWSPTGDYRIDLFGDDLLHVAEAFEHPPHLIGASLGGIAGMVALGESDRSVFASLTLVDITPTMERSGVDRVMGFMAEHAEEGFASLQEAADVIAAYLPHRPRPKTLDGLNKNLRKGGDGRYRWHWDPRFVTGVMDRGTGQSPERLVEAARKIDVPVLLVRGRSSELVSEQAAQEFLQIVPHARLIDVTGARHMVAGDHNDLFTDAVLEFLGSPPPDGKSAVTDAALGLTVEVVLD